MNYHNITTDDMSNGDGLRAVLWVSGCTHNCSGCHNPQTWCASSGILFDENAQLELFEKLNKPYIKGITFSGGDPFHENNIELVSVLINTIKNNFPDKDIWVYTGYEWNDIKYLPVLRYVDVLIDGKFIEELKNTKLKWRGSSNQKIIMCKESLQKGYLVLHQDN